MNVEAPLPPIGREFWQPLAESSTLETLWEQKRVCRSLIVRDEERSSTAVGKLSTLGAITDGIFTDLKLVTHGTLAHGSLAVPGTLVGPGTVIYSTRTASPVQNPMSRFLEQDLLLFSLYAPNVAARIVSMNSPQELWVPPDTYLADTSWQFHFGFAAPTPSPGLTKVQMLERAYVTEDAAKVGSFVEQNRLTDILIAAVEPLKKTFGETLTRTLTLVEDDEGSRTLFCFVAFPGALDEAQKALDSFDRGWWLRNVKEFGPKLNFDFELV